MASKLEVTEMAKDVMENYFIEYNFFLTNHFSHGLIALWKMGASKEHISKYVEHYKNEKLEPLNGPTGTRLEQGEHVPEEVEQLFGARKGFFKLVRYYRKQFEENQSDLSKLINTQFPVIMKGICGSLLHPIIHIGYGLELELPDLVIEGLAYAHYSYAEPVWNKEWECSKLGQGSKTFLEILEMVRNGCASLKKYMFENQEKKLTDLPGARFQAKILALFDRADELMEYVMALKMDQPSNSDQMATLLDLSIYMFANCELTNEFFLLHGITSVWALRKVSLCLESEIDLKTSICVLLCGILAVYIVCGCPKVLDQKARDKEEELEMKSWEELKEELISKSVEETDEHDYKLFQICHERSQENGTKENMYKKAVKQNIDNKFSMTIYQISTKATTATTTTTTTTTKSKQL